MGRDGRGERWKGEREDREKGEKCPQGLVCWALGEGGYFCAIGLLSLAVDKGGAFCAILGLGPRRRFFLGKGEYFHARGRLAWALGKGGYFSALLGLFAGPWAMADASAPFACLLWLWTRAEPSVPSWALGQGGDFGALGWPA